MSLVFTVALGAAADTVFMYSLLPPHAIPFVQGKTVDLAWIEGSVPAGFPSPAADFAQKRQDFNDLLVVHPAATFMWQARGVSMIEFGISDGDILVVDRALRAQRGDIVVAEVDGDFTGTKRPLPSGSSSVCVQTCWTT